MGKHAYLILAHKNFNQLKTLITLLDDPRNDIFIHVDAKAKKFNEQDFNNICKHSRLIFLPMRNKVNWGGVSIMRTELALLKTAASSGTYDYYHLLSGMDMPLKTQDEIHEFFNSHKGKEFINLWEIQPDIIDRFKYVTVFPEGQRVFHTRLVNKAFIGLQKWVGYNINKDVVFYYGSQWFSITDNLVRHILGKEDWLEKVFKSTSICDEIFLPTLVCNSRFKENLFIAQPSKSNKDATLGNMRLIDWTRGESGRHPWTFKKEDYHMLKSAKHLFARKFDENVDENIIKMLYADLAPIS